MIFQGEDDKIVVDNFKGLFIRGSTEETDTDHAQDCLNVMYTAKGQVATRDGTRVSLSLPQGGGVRRFFLMEAIPFNIGDTVPLGLGLLWLDNHNNLYNDLLASPILTLGGMTDFSAVNINNRTYLSPNNGQSGFLKGKLKIISLLDGTIRDAAGSAPETGTALEASNYGSGNVAVGKHKIAVIYETDTGFWTPPGPKKYQSITPTPSDPTVFTAPNHGMVTGESHRIAQSGSWGAPFSFSDTWHITRIDDNSFSVPVNSVPFGPATGSFQMAGAFTPAEVVSDGLSAIKVDAIPIGPSYIKRRIILATRAEEEEFFFVPNVPGSQSEIPNNTDTSTVINFDDTDLIDSADYLFDILEAVPGGACLCKYRNRLVIAGIYPQDLSERALLSNINDYETFNWVSGYVQVQNERDGNNLTCCYVLRDVLYLAKFTGTFSTQDNGSNPSTWAVSVTDAVIGCYAHGISNFTETQNAADTGDVVVLASKIGLILFDGVMRRPEMSYNIEGLWSRITPTAFAAVTVAHDPWTHTIYVSVPTDGETTASSILACNYSDGRGADAVRWGLYTFPFTPTCIGMLYFGAVPPTTSYTLKIGSVNGTHNDLYEMGLGLKNDLGQKINNYYTPGSFYLSGIGCWKLIHARTWGVGALQFTVSGLDSFGSYSPPSWTLVPKPGREYDRQINFTNEKMILKLESGGTQGAVNDYLFLDRLDVWGIPLWPIRPSV